MAKILFLGDFYYDYDFINEDISILQKYIKDNELLTILNLEGAITNNKKNPIKKRGPNLASSEKSIEVLKKLNVIGVCLANNHMCDFGQEGLKDTIDILDNNNIKHTGAGSNLEEAIKPMVLSFDKKQYYIYNYGWDKEETLYAKKNKYGCSPRNEKIIINNLRKNVTEDNYNIITMHWGFEYNLYPQPYDRNLAYKMLDNGANLIIGHHPHNIQSKEVFKEKEIYYSLGNFYFSSRRDRFINKKFNCEQYKDRCNYGLGVIFNTETNEVDKTILFYYNSNSKQTNIVDNSHIIEHVNENITNKYNNDSNYIKKIKDTRLNINPILTSNSIINIIKLKRLSLIRTIQNIKNILYVIKKRLLSRW